jgi:integrase
VTSSISDVSGFFTLALAIGMRRGEILGLTWDCIDWKNNSILIKGSISRVKDPDTGISSLKYAEPKTKSGKRQIPILSNLALILEAHKTRQSAEKFLAGSAWNKQNLVFCSNVGTPIEPRRIRTTMEKLTTKAGLPSFTFHSLRHTFATRMLEANVPAKVVQEILGHTDVTLTLNTYSHVIGTTAHDQMEKINDLFNYDEAFNIIPIEKATLKDKMEVAQKKVNAKENNVIVGKKKSQKIDIS